MVRSVGRGQFRVRGAWVELPPLQRLVEPGLIEDIDFVPHRSLDLVLDGFGPVEETEQFEGGLASAFEGYPWSDAPGPSHGAGPLVVVKEMPTALAVPESPPRVELLVPPEAPAVPVHGVPSAEPGPGPSPTLPVPELPDREVGASTPEGVAAASDAGRTLAALLARMWLVRTATSSAAAISLPTPAPPPAPEPPRLRATPMPPQSPHVALAVVDSVGVHAADDDDRRPTSGLASFVVELASLSRPSTAPPNAAIATPPKGDYRMVMRFVHCPHPVPEQPVSRDACSLARTTLRDRAFGRAPD